MKKPKPKPRVDWVGVRLGNVVIGEPFFKTNSKGKDLIFYHCKCDCGNHFDRSSNALGKARDEIIRWEENQRLGPRRVSCGCNIWRTEMKDDPKQIPELKGVDLDQYRKEAKETWRLTCSCSV